MVTFNASNYSGLGPTSSFSSKTPQPFPKVCPVLRSMTATLPQLQPPLHPTTPLRVQLLALGMVSVLAPPSLGQPVTPQSQTQYMTGDHPGLGHNSGKTCGLVPSAHF